MTAIDPNSPNTFLKYTDDVTPVSAAFLEALAVQFDDGDEAVDELSAGDLLMLDRTRRGNIPGAELATEIYGLGTHEVSAIATDGRWTYVASSDGSGGVIGIRRVAREDISLVQGFPVLTETVATGTKIRLATNGDYVVVTYGEHVELFDVTGAPFVSEWTFSTDVEIQDVDIDDTHVFITHTRDGSDEHVYALAIADGSTTWSEDLGAGVGAQNFIRTDGRLVFFGGDADSTGVNLHGRVAADGSFAFSKKLVGNVTAGTLVGGSLWAADANTVYQLRPYFDDIQTVGTFPADGSTITGIAATEKYVAFSLSSAVVVVDAESGQPLWPKTLPGTVNDISIDGEYLFVGHEVGSSVNTAVYDLAPSPTLARITDPTADVPLSPRLYLQPVARAGSQFGAIYGQLGTSNGKSFTASGSEETITQFDESLELGPVDVNSTTGEITILEAGKYRVSFDLTVGSASAPGQTSAHVEVDGSAVGLNALTAIASGENGTLSGSKILDFDGDEVLTLRFVCSNVSLSQVYATFRAEKVVS